MKWVTKYGHRVQYSVYEIDNGKSILNNLIVELEKKWEKKFSEEDSVLIISTSETCKILRFGYAKHAESDIIIV